MKIEFVRHGQPDFDTRKWVAADSVGRSLQQYHDARVTTPPLHDLSVGDCKACPYIITSELVRAQDSVSLCQESDHEVSGLLNEAELPHPDRLIAPLPWSVLLFFCRLAWLLGYRSNAPGIVCDRARARQASAFLIKRALEYGHVCVFGHGIMNRLIVSELTKSGWSVKSRTGSGYWSRTVVCADAVVPSKSVAVE